jgi:hypothetical protein
MEVRNKRAIRTQGFVPKEACERKQAAIAKCADPSMHGARLELGRLQVAQWQPSGPEQPMNENGPHASQMNLWALQIIAIAMPTHIRVATDEMTSNVVIHGASYVFTMVPLPGGSSAPFPKY